MRCRAATTSPARAPRGSCTGKGCTRTSARTRGAQPCYVRDLERNRTIAVSLALGAPSRPSPRDSIEPEPRTPREPTRTKEEERGRRVGRRGRRGRGACVGGRGAGRDGAHDDEDRVPATEECGRLEDPGDRRRGDCLARAGRSGRRGGEGGRGRAAAAPAEQTPSQTQRGSTQALGRCARLSMTQARHLYLMAHGEAPKRAPRSEARAAAASSTRTWWRRCPARTSRVQTRRGRRRTQAERDDANRRRRETVAAEGAAAAARGRASKGFRGAARVVPSGKENTLW